MTTYYTSPRPVVGAQRSVLAGPDPDFRDNALFATKAIAGTVFDTSGTPVSGATVELYRHNDRKFCASTTSDASGNYSFTRYSNDPNTDYWVVAFTVSGGSTKIHGTSDWSLVPA